MSFNVLVTEDDERIGASVKAALVAAGYHVVLARSCEEALFAAAAQRFDLLVLDIGLPGRDGLTVLSALREGRTDLAVLILSSRSLPRCLRSSPISEALLGEGTVVVDIA
jgi:DNA-binding response OmpR family regulator